MADTNLFQELKDALQDFKDFLDTNVPIIQPAILTLTDLVPPLADLIDQLSSLLTELKTAIVNLDVSNIPGLSEVAEFTGKITTVLETAKALLPDQEGAIQEVLDAAGVAGSLPSLEEVKGEIVSLLTAIIGHVDSLKAP